METQQTSTRRSAKEMYPLIAAYENSDQSQAIFCAHHGLKQSTFSYWRGKYLRAGQEEEPRFVNLVPQASACGISLQYGGVDVRFGSEVSLEVVAELVRKLGEGC